MSVAKPSLEYIKTLKTKTDWSRSGKAFRILLKYHRHYFPFFVVVILISVLRSYLFTLEPLYTAQIIDKVITKSQFDLLLGLVLNIVLAVIGFGVTNFIIVLISGYAAQLIIRDIRTDYYVSLQEKSFGFYDRTEVGDLLSRATMDLQAVDMFLRAWINNIADAVFSIVLVFLTMYSISTQMSLMALLPMPFIFYFTVQLFTRVMPLFRRMQLILGRLGAYIQQNIIGMKNVRIFQEEKEMEDGFKTVETIYVNTAIDAGRVQAIYTPTAQAVLSLGMIFIYIYGTNLITSSMLTLGYLILFTRYMMRLTMPLRNMSQLIGTWVNASAGLERVLEIENMPVDVKDLPEAKEIQIKEGEVEFRNVNFGYVKDRIVLRNINMKVKPGEKIAILGATGSGKTSLVYLIPRFYDVDSGNISIDGVDVRNYKLSSLRTQVGLVLQDVFLFAGTIRDNVAFGRPDASMDEIRSAAKLAQIHDFIETLPEGYDTMVGERGITLSGGQKQRVTIARALLTNARILILDDSLSFVDAKTEQEIQQALESAMKGRTTFIIAQRLSTIKNADRIVVLSNGEIVEVGTHSELMAEAGIYKRIYETQFLETTTQIAPEAGAD
ncbi:ABC transporter ATP-binding protein/permease [Candidatus Bathyarchaeota archaeon]|nr:ABC transporter ATP-binding protein/permease [Candidatus Bathyarchaeota archaeon]